ncbi:hypothetical protein [Streptomyces sp. NPDC087525]|uniref:hypothetical protein n=1 Tax=Streptomyces sp. NPDC087525 TaxID=3365793 RepID=UPI0037FF05A2
MPARGLFTQEIQREPLNLLGPIGASQPGREDRAGHVVARLGDGGYAKGVMSLVPPDVAEDPDKPRAMRDRLEEPGAAFTQLKGSRHAPPGMRADCRWFART